MKKHIENVLAFLGLCVLSFFVAYAWDIEAELQEQKEIKYMHERGLK